MTLNYRTDLCLRWNCFFSVFFIQIIVKFARFTSDRSRLKSKFSCGINFISRLGLSSLLFEQTTPNCLHKFSLATQCRRGTLNFIFVGTYRRNYCSIKVLMSRHDCNNFTLVDWVQIFQFIRDIHLFLTFLANFFGQLFDRRTIFRNYNLIMEKIFLAGSFCSKIKTPWIAHNVKNKYYALFKFLQWNQSITRHFSAYNKTWNIPNPPRIINPRIARYYCTSNMSIRDSSL